MHCWCRPREGCSAGITPTRRTFTRRNMKLDRLWRWAVLAGVAAWQAWAVWYGSPFFPPPAVIADRMYHTWFSGPPSHLFLTSTAVGNILPSLGRVACGLAIAVALAV